MIFFNRLSFLEVIKRISINFVKLTQLILFFENKIILLEMGIDFYQTNYYWSYNYIKQIIIKL